MHHRVPTPRKAWSCRILSGLAVLFLPAWAIKSTPSPSLPSPGAPPEDHRGMPYLRVIGPTPLRFEDAPVPPPDLVTRPVAGGPPQPAAPAAPVAHAAGTPPPASPAAGQNQASPPAPGQPPATPPVPILPDETRPKVQPEDFLPFFQFPAAPGEVTAPNPSDRPPPSSATYRKQ